MGFQSAEPTRSKGQCHALFFNCFEKVSFPQGLYWPDIALQVQEMLATGVFAESIQVAPVNGTSIGHQGCGVLAMGADGAYVNGVYLYAISLLLFGSLGAAAPTLPQQLARDISAVTVRHTRHPNVVARCVYLWQETATKSALNRPLEPFMQVRAVAQFGGVDKVNVADVIKRFNQHFFAQPQLQITGKAAMRIKCLISPDTTDPTNLKLTEEHVAEHGWAEGAWSNQKLDFEGFYVGKLARHTSHPDWIRLFTAGRESQSSAVAWNHDKHMKGHNPPAAAFHEMVCRLVLSHALVELLLRPASVTASLCDSFINDVKGGMHHAALDEVLNGPLQDDFRMANARSWAKQTLPIIETIINQQVAQQLGLDAKSVKEMEKVEARQKQDSWKNKCMLDVDRYVKTWNAFQAVKTSFADAEKNHKQKVNDYALKAVEAYVFGKGKESDGQGGIMDLEHMKTQEFVARYIPHLTDFIRSCMSSHGAQQNAIMDADVCIIFLPDFGQLGSLKTEHLRNVVQVQSNLFGLQFDVVTLCFYPEKARGFSQFQLSLSEKKELAEAGEVEGDSDADMLTDDAAVLPLVSVDAQVKKTKRELRAALSKDKADIDTALARGNLGVWYPEGFSIAMDSTAASLRAAREGFLLQSVAAQDWFGAKIAGGALTDALPVNKTFVKVSRQAAKKARAENKVSTVASGAAGANYKYQKGAAAERKILEDIVAGVRKKKMIVFADPFMGPADKAIAFLELLQEHGSTRLPLVFYYGCEPRWIFLKHQAGGQA